MRTIFIPHLPMRQDAATGAPVPTVDLSAAVRYGELRPIVMTQHWSPTDMDELQEEMEALQEDDLIMCLGDIVALAAAINIANARYGHANLLRYDRATQSYTTQRVTL